MTSTAKIVWLICLIFVPLVGFACPDQIKVLSGSWEEGGGKFSLVVQAQDSGGEVCKVSETLRLGFAGPGRFSNEGDTAKPQAYISKNSSNRNFYYHGQSGDQITIRAGFGLADAWTENWQADFIIGGDDSSASDDSSQTQVSNSDDDYTVLSTQTEEKTFSAKTNWRIGAGQDRLVLVGSRVTFKVEDSASDKERTIYYWSFGDGAAVRGAVASHTYRYPGVYQVVVTAKDSFGREAAARVKVKVIAPTVAVNFVDQTGSVRVSNQNGEEINLGNFQLIASDQPTFVFPTDTIISVGQTIVVDQSISGLEFSPQLSLLDPTGHLVAESNLAAKAKADLTAQLVSLQARLLSAQHQLATASFKSTSVVTTKISPVLITDQEPAPTERVVTLEKTSPSPLKRLLNFFKMK